jgi:hypothetical protein
MGYGYTVSTPARDWFTVNRTGQRYIDGYRLVHGTIGWDSSTLFLSSGEGLLRGPVDGDPGKRDDHVQTSYP